MVLECPSPCENLVQFMRCHGGGLDEEKAQHIMRQAAHTANMCCLRGVLHRDIKLDNLLINSETSKVKLVDFGCGGMLRSSPYRSYSDKMSFLQAQQRTVLQSTMSGGCTMAGRRPHGH